MDRLSSMAAFVKAVEMGSFSAAGDALQMSAQLIGKHVHHLEHHLGVRLLNRTTRRQSLTDFGREFYERSKFILAEVESAENLAAHTQALPSGRLRINAPVSFGMQSLAPRLPEFMEANPLVSIELSLANRAIDLIDEGFDVVFRVGQLADSGLVARELAPYKLVLCAAPSYLQGKPAIETPWNLQDHECLGFSHTELRTHWTFNGPEGTVVVPVGSRFMADHGEPLLCAALAGLGILLQPEELVRQSLESGELVSLLPDYPPPSRPLHVLYAPDRRLTPKLRSFLDFAIAAFGADSIAPERF
jgi:DNA-binding transcriptional LysR family regulator